MQEYKTKVLLYNISPERKLLFSNFINDNDIEIIDVQTKDYLKSLGSLLEIESFEVNTEIYLGKAFEEEMLVMFNFDEELMNNFLNYFRDNKIPSIRLKAMLTPTNANWNSIALYKELKQEHEYYESMRRKK